MKISYDVKITAQNDLGREYSVIQTVEHSNGNIDRNNLYRSEYKNNKGLHDCHKKLQELKKAL